MPIRVSVIKSICSLLQFDIIILNLLPYSGNEQNGEVFRENGGTKCTLTLVNYNKPRRLALRLLTQLILLKGKTCTLIKL